MLIMFRTIILLLFSFLIHACGLSQSNSLGTKINGACLVNPPRPVEPSMMAAVKSINAQWVAVVPYAFSRQNEPEVYFNNQRQWWGERVAGTKALIEMAQDLDLEVMIKPHIWMRGGFIGDFDLLNEADWKEWERSYEAYITTYALLADSMQVPMLCIGTEIKKAAVKREQFWRDMIARIRLIYDGKITYAANWDNYHLVQFWDALDYIGVDAYFPLTEVPDPDVETIVNAWNVVKEDLRKFSLQYDKPILFTEFGYQSLNGAAGKHWEIEQSIDNVNMEIQATAYEGLFRSFWDETWFAGGFLWKWHLKDDAGGLNNTRFTPQNKPAAKIIAKWYEQTN